VSSMAWATYALRAWRDGRIDYKQAVHAISYTVMECLKRFGEGSPVMNEFYDIVQHHGSSLDRLYAAYKPFWLALLAAHPSTCAPQAATPLPEAACMALPV
jgi:hypothetical protein